MNSIAAIKTANDDFEVEYEMLSPIDISAITDPTRQELAVALQDVDTQISLCEDEIAKLSAEIDRLTNHADGLDYTVAVASGILTGLIDSIFVGEIDIKSATEKAEKEIADKVKEKALKEKQEETIKKAIEGAKKKGKKLSKEEIEKIKEGVRRDFFSKANNASETEQDPVLKQAIRYLARKHPIPQDNLYVGTGSSPATHHLDDIAHHFSLTGMIASIVVQFLRVATFVNKDGKWTFKFVKTDTKELVELWLPIIISGLLNWLACIAERNIKTEDGEKLPEPIVKIVHLLASAPAIIQVIKAIDRWCLHLYSDVAGSESSKGRGAGIPGLFISLLKEISSIPPLNFTGLPKAVEYLYSTQQVDLRTELGIAKELGKQAVPVIINEVLVRTFYFVRHLVSEYKAHDSFDDIDWQKVFPIGNRTIERMMTIASGTFTAVDIADAAIRSGGFNAACLLRVNFVGVGRFAVAIGTDVAMGVKRGKLQKEKYIAIGRQLDLLDVKVSYLYASAEYEISDSLGEQSKLWITAEDTVSTLMEASECTTQAVEFYKESLQEISESRRKISDYLDAIEQKNPGIKKETLDTIRWGDLSWKHN